MTSCPRVEIKALVQFYQAEEQKVQILFLKLYVYVSGSCRCVLQCGTTGTLNVGFQSFTRLPFTGHSLCQGL